MKRHRPLDASALETLLEEQKAKRSKRQDRIASGEADICSSLAGQEQDLEARERALERDRQALDEVVKERKRTLMQGLEPAPEVELLELLSDMADDGPIFFPDDHRVVETFQALKEATPQALESAAGPGPVNRTAAETPSEDAESEADELPSLPGLSHQQVADLAHYVKDNVEMRDEKAVFAVSGRLEGYKGRDTTFERVSGDEGPELVTGNARPYKADDNDVWEWYYDRTPRPDDINWPDHKSQWAHAKVYGTVTVVSVKPPQAAAVAAGEVKVVEVVTEPEAVVT
jgi:hypothetical protein